MQLTIFKSAKKKVTVKLEDRVIQLGEGANIWRKIALISDSCEVDHDIIISNSELTVTLRCLMKRKQTLYSGYPGKLKLFTALKVAAGVSTTKLYFVDCIMKSKDRNRLSRCCLLLAR